MKKKNIAILITILLLLISTCTGIMAYLVAQDEAINTFKIGACNVEIVENFEPPKVLEPGTSFVKEVNVENSGPSECYVRIKAVFTDSFMGDNCTVDWNTEDFVYNSEDGYYYYTEPLSVGESTSNLFNEVSVSEELSANEIKEFDILVYAEAYQSYGFDDYEEAWEHYSRNKPE